MRKGASRRSGLGGVNPQIEGNDTLRDLSEAGQMLVCRRKQAAVAAASILPLYGEPFTVIPCFQ